ncbi:MAG: SPOR domain-containing protein [Deltaproteobacteria bacterium]|nr:SPOR domain-containing protein [Deltaproteobacteria bacterium]
MGTKKPEQGNTGKRYQFELSRTAIFLWSAGVFVLLAWIFTLGVLAGRGLLPGGAETLTELKTQIAKLQHMINKKDRSELAEIRALQKDPEFAFFDELSVKKAEPEKPSGTPAGKPPGAAVTQKPVKPATSAMTREKAKPPGVSVKYVVQVASLETEDKATNMVNRLTRKGYPAYFYKVFVKGREYFRVRCGTFKTEAEAVKLQKMLIEKEKLTGFVQKVEGN